MDNVITASDLLTTAGLIAAVMLIVQLTKVWIPDPWLVPAILAMGVVLSFVGAVLFGLTTPQELINAFFRGLAAAAAAIAVFQGQKPFGVLSTKTEQQVTQGITPAPHA